MSLANGRAYLAIPGPSVMPEEVLRAMHRSAPNIYEGELIEMTAGLIPDLRAVARTQGDVAIYIANGHGAWEAALANTVAPGERVLVPATGRFGHGWAEVAQLRGIEAEILDFGRRAAVDPDRVEAALRADKDHAIRAVLATHADTSTSVLNDIAALRAVLDATGHPALLMADCIASLACDQFEMDAWGVDVMVAGSQKGLMVPPGLAFVCFSEKAAAARARMSRVSRYWDWTNRADPQMFYQYFGGTAPTHHLFGLRAALDLIKAEGIEAIWHRHEVLARAIWAACETWGAGGPLELNIADPALRSRAVTALRIGAPHGSALRQWVQGHARATRADGLGRVDTAHMADAEEPVPGHMGHVNAHMILGALGAIESGLIALDIPHGPGGQQAAAQVIAGR